MHRDDRLASGRERESCCTGIRSGQRPAGSRYTSHLAPEGCPHQVRDTPYPLPRPHHIRQPAATGTRGCVTGPVSGLRRSGRRSRCGSRRRQSRRVVSGRVEVGSLSAECNRSRGATDCEAVGRRAACENKRAAEGQQVTTCRRRATNSVSSGTISSTHTYVRSCRRIASVPCLVRAGDVPSIPTAGTQPCLLSQPAHECEKVPVN